MQKIFGGMSTGERPIIFVAPLVGAQDEKPDWFRTGELIGNVLEKIVVPGQCDFIFVERGGRAEVHLADFAPCTGMSADRYQQALSAACGFICAVLLDSDVVAQRASEEDVVPGRDGQRGNCYVGVMVLDRP